MKNFLIFILLVLAVPLSAKEFIYEDLVYTVLDEELNTVETKAGYEEGTGTEVTYYPGNEVSDKKIIPSKVYDYDEDKEYTVIRIGDYGFAKCTTLSSIVMPETLTEVGDYAFFQCISIRNIEFPASVNSIGKYALSGCTWLTSVKLPDSITEIKFGTFTTCFSLEDIEIPHSVTEIGRGAFMGCTKLKDINIPENVSIISEQAFLNCSGLTSLSLPQSLSTVGAYAFSNCNALSSVYYNTLTSPATGTNTSFSATTYQKATLYVPQGMIEEMKLSSPWQDFESIQEFDFSGIKEIFENNNSIIEYFDFNGIRLTTPKSGQLLIQRKGNKIKKIKF